MKKQYVTNHFKPRFQAAILVSDSYPSRGEINFKTPGRAKAMNTVAAACIPPVLLNMSMIVPKTKAKTNTNQFGVSTGSNMMNKIYT